MSEHRASIRWALGEAGSGFDEYPRDHEWHFGEAQRVPASAAPEYQGSPERVDPEQALVAAIASCHMLTFLTLAARRRIPVESYQDEAVGVLEKGPEGRLAITRVTLRPRIRFRDGEPERGLLERLHAQAHEHCFIANSVRTEIEVEL